MRVDRLASVAVLGDPPSEDERGWFRQVFQASEVGRSGARLEIRQGNHSFSHPNVLRGIHVEPWSKLVYVVSGHARIVVVDLDPGSPEFGMHMVRDCRVDAEGAGVALHIPRGYGNGFYAFAPTQYLNLVSSEFTPEGRSGVRWDDPDLGIDWGNGGREPVVSAADRGWTGLDGFVRSRSPSG